MANSKIPNLDFYHTIEKTPDNFMHFSDAQKREWLSDAAFNRNTSYGKFSGFSITKSQLALIDDAFINFVKKNLRNEYLIIDVSEDAVISPEELKKLAVIKDTLEKANVKVYFNEHLSYYSFDKVCEANAKLDAWAEEIRNLTIDGKSLSPLEKFYVAYSYVTQFEYRESTNSGTSRNLISVLTGDKIVCVGYSQMLKALCEKLDISCETQLVAVNSRVPNHMNCQVTIKDEKYGVNGTYYSDPCYDSKSRGECSIAHALLPYSEIPKLFRRRPIRISDKKTTRSAISTDINKKENLDKISEDISTFLLQFQDEFSKYIDDSVYGMQNHLFVKQPKQKDLQNIIDQLIECKFNNLDGILSADDKHLSDFLNSVQLEKLANMLLKYTKIKSIEELKALIFEEMKTYIPSFDSETFLTLSNAYTKQEESKDKAVLSKEKQETESLTFVQLESLLENLEKIEGKREVDLYSDTSPLISSTIARAIKCWSKYDQGTNIISKIKQMYVYRTETYGAGAVKSGKQLMEDYRKVLESRKLIPKKGEEVQNQGFESQKPLQENQSNSQVQTNSKSQITNDQGHSVVDQSQITNE